MPEGCRGGGRPPPQGRWSRAFGGSLAWLGQEQPPQMRGGRTRQRTSSWTWSRVCEAAGTGGWVRSTGATP